MIRMILLIILSISTVYADMTGNWISDWRNEYTAATCPPKSFSIQESNGAYTIDYVALPNCDPGYSSSLTQSLPNTWSDNSGFSFTYEPTNDTILYDFVHVMILYDRNGSYIDRNLFQATSYGNWVNPQPVSNSTACYPPNNITVVYSTSEYSDTERFVYVNGSTDDSAYSLVISDYAELLWQDGYNTLAFSYDDSANQTYLQFYNDKTSTCIYSYTKLNGLLLGTWYSDWQNDLQVMTSVQITSDDDLTMTMKIFTNASADFTDGGPEGPYSVPFFQLAAPNLYQVGFEPDYGITLNTPAYDEADILTFKYDPTADVLIAQGLHLVGDGNSQIFDYLLTRNGSILSAEPFYGSWGNPQLVNVTKKGVHCCIPYHLKFSNRTDYSDNTDDSDNNMIVTTYFYQNSSNTFCLQNNDQNTTLGIPNPSAYQLIWKQIGGYPVYDSVFFTDPSQTSQITVILDEQDFLPDGTLLDYQCTFTLSQGYTPTPHPIAS